MTTPVKQILFICTGNICRSPMAEHIFRQRVGKESGWTSGSAGLIAVDGIPASANAVQALAEWKIDLTGHRSRPVTAGLLASADLIVVMTDQHLQTVLQENPDLRGRVRLLTTFGTGKEARNIPDPIGQSLHVYRTVRDQIDSAVADLILDLMERGELTPPPKPPAADASH